MARLPHANRAEAGSIIWVFLLGFASTLVSLVMIGSRWRRLFTTRSVHHTSSNLDTVTVDRVLVPVPVPASATANRPAPVDNDHGAAHPDQAGSGPVIRLTIPSMPSIGEMLRRARDFPIPVHATMGTRRLAIAGFAAVVLAIGLSPVGGTIATFVASLINPESTFQSGTVRLASDGAGSSAFSLPALLPGESVERVITVSQSGSLDSRLDLAILPDAASSNSPLVTDPTSGIQIIIDRCVAGAWATTTPVAAMPTPPPAGARFACVPATPSAVPSTQPVYRGPLVPRGITRPGTPTTTPVPIPVADRLRPGDEASLRIRASLPEQPWSGDRTDDTATAPGGNGSVAFEWRATGMNANLSGTPLATAPTSPVTRTPVPATPAGPAPTATSTASPTAIATATGVPSATMTASPTATQPAYAGYAAAFDGYGDDVLIGWAQPIGPLSGRPAWTFEAWVNPSDLTGPRTIYSEQDAYGADTLVIRLRRDAQPQVLEAGLRRNDTLTWFGIESPADIVTGTWTHVAVTFEVGSRLQLALNGTVRLADTNSTDGRLASLDSATVSTLARAGDGSPGYAGAIDEVRLWSVARAYDASNATYLQKLAGGEPRLLVHYPISAYASTDARGATLADQSGNGISGTLRGGVRWIPSRAPVDRPATPHSIGLSAATDTGASTSDGITKLNAVTVTGRASAGSTVALFDGSGTTAIATGTASSDNTFAIPVTLAAGDHSITGRATDSQSKSSGTSVARVITVDQTAPTTIVNLTFADEAGTPGPYRQGTVVTVTAVLAQNPTDLAPSLTLNLVSGTHIGGTLPSTVLTSADGTTYTGTLTIPAGNGTVLPSLVATDIAGNQIASSNVRLPNPTAYVGSDGTWSMDGTGYATVSVCGGATAAPPAQWIWSSTCSVAWQTHTFAKDFSVSGLLTAATLDLTIDNWASITINGDPVAWPYSSNQYEAYATLTPFDVTGKVRSGSNTISIYAEDYGGGSGVLARLTMTGVPGFVIDNTAPTVVLSYSDGGASNATGPYKSGDRVTVTASFTESNAISGTPTVTLAAGTYAGGTLPTVTLALSSWMTYTGTFTIPAGNGTVKASVSATDTAGNVLSASGVNGFTIDNTAPTVGEVQRQLVAETSSTWNAPRYTVTATDSVGIATVMLQTATSSTGPWTDSGTAVTQPFSGSIYVVSGPTISGTKWVRMSVKDAAGNESITDSVLVTVWNASSANAEWTTGGSAYFSGGWLVLTPSSGGQKGGGYFEPLVSTGGQVSVSFDLEVNGSADGMCVPFFSSASAFLTGDAGGSLGCQGMAGTFFVGIEEYGTDTIRIGTPSNGLYSETTVSGLVNTSNSIRITIILTPSGGSTLTDVRAQVGSANPVQMASRTMSGTLPSAGILVGFTAGTGGETAEHKIRNIVISGSN